MKDFDKSDEIKIYQSILKQLLLSCTIGLEGKLLEFCLSSIY